MKTDWQLKRDIEEELDWDPAVDAAAIGVAVRDGVVTLTGHIDRFAEKSAAERAVRRVAGVKAIAVELDVRLAPGHRRSDTEIAGAARSTLDWCSPVGDRVQASVESGWLTLRGEVEWAFQRDAAEAAVRPLAGVVGLSNLIVLKPRLSPSNVKERITASLRRQAAREAEQLDVVVNGGVVTLSGRVASWQEREAAQGAAWSAPGVTAVLNHLVIA